LLNKKRRHNNDNRVLVDWNKFGCSGLASGGQEVNIEIFAIFAIGSGLQTAKVL